MMSKKYYVIVSMACIFTLLVTGCGGQSAAPATESPVSEAAGGSGLADKDIFPAVNDSAVQEGSNTGADPAVDVDLTIMSSTMVYAEVFNITTNPTDYLGKTIKLSGPYTPSYYDETDMYYHYVIVEDAAACCQQGLEFIWNGDHTYPGDYPEANARIEVAGVFGSYEELGLTYYYLAVDEIQIMDELKGS